MRTGQILALLGVILTQIADFFAFYPIMTSQVGSGIGFINNIGVIILHADVYANGMNIPIWFFFVILGLIIIFLQSGLFQIIGIWNRVASLVFALFPLLFGICILLSYNGLFGTGGTVFLFLFWGEQIGNIFPFLIPIGELGLGTYLIISGGLLGIISVFFPRIPRTNV